MFWDEYEKPGDDTSYSDLINYAQHLESHHDRIVVLMETLIYMLQKELSRNRLLVFLKFW